MDDEDEKKFCSICQKYVKGTYYNRHQAEKHRPRVRFQKIMCPICLDKFNLRAGLRTHLHTIHNKKIAEHSFKVHNWDDFVKWLQNEENEKQFRFVRQRKPDRLQNGDERSVYYCQYDNTRDFRLVPDARRKRRQKHQGSCKQMGSCPVELIVKKSVVRDHVTILVQYFSTHVGHEISSAHFRISQECRRELAEKIKAGISFDQILNDVRNNTRTQQLQHDLKSRKTLHKIIASPISDWQRDDGADDASSVFLWIQSVEKLNFNPVCLFKMQGEDYPALQRNDFVLVVMTEIQAETLKELGNRIICVDSMRGANPHDFSLTTIVVVDDHEEVFPAAFLISSRIDESILEIFFSQVRAKLDVLLSPAVFISDDVPAYLDAWTKVMKTTTAPRQLLCTWHVDRQWRDALDKVGGRRETVKEKQVSLYRMLRILIQETNKKKFFELLGSLMTDLMSDKATAQFGRYFKKTYADRCAMWAHSFRAGAGGENANAKIEDFHRLLKKVYNKGVPMKRLALCIDDLLRIVRDKHVERITKLAYIRTPYIIQKLEIAHTRGAAIPDAGVEETDSCYKVRSQNDGQSAHVIKRIYENCPYGCQLICRQCDACIHMYQCSCVGCTIKCHMCKHVHKVCLLRKRSVSAAAAPCTPAETVDGENGAENNVENLPTSLRNDNEQFNETAKELKEKIKYLVEVETYEMCCTTQQIEMSIKDLDDVISRLSNKPSKPNSSNLQSPNETT